MRGLSKAAAPELGPCDIRVNTIHPGFIETEMTAFAAPAFGATNIHGTPLGHVLLDHQGQSPSGVQTPGSGPVPLLPLHSRGLRQSAGAAHELAQRGARFELCPGFSWNPAAVRTAAVGWCGRRGRAGPCRRGR
ncbi:SDR family oxidoreductase [Streptomyces sp. NPDC052164]|uniref:SDR family oxidoreductase n=1 Tax=Streptomyces sp. NPDC052164 TaxID=3155529 RepID=UPI0034221C68